MRTEPLTDKVGLKVMPDADETVMDLDPAAVIELFKAHGALYFSGFNLDVTLFERFTNQFSNDYMDNTGSGSYRDQVEGASDKSIQNVAYVYGTDKQRLISLPLHADRSYVKSQPPLMWFMCARPSKEGGQTTVCDGVALAEALSERARQVFTEQRLKYIRHYPAGEWQVLFKTDDLGQVRAYCDANDLTLIVNDDGSVTTEFLKPAIFPTRYGDLKGFVNSILIQLWQEDALGRTTSLARLEDGSRIPEDVLDEVKDVSERLTVDLAWEPGDFARVDNTRLMHGRRPFSDPEREIYVRMCRGMDW